MIDPTIARSFEAGTYQVTFLHQPAPLTQQGRFDIVDRDAAGILIRHRTVGQELVLVFVPWSNIISIDLSK